MNFQSICKQSPFGVSLLSCSLVFSKRLAEVGRRGRANLFLSILTAFWPLHLELNEGKILAAKPK